MRQVIAERGVAQLLRALSLTLALLSLAALLLLVVEAARLPAERGLAIQASFISEDQSLAPAQAWQQLLQSEAKATPRFGEFHHWYRVHLQAGSWVLMFDNPMQSRIDVFDPASATPRRLAALGDKQATSKEQRALPHLPVVITGNNGGELLVHSYTTGAANLPMVLFSADDFRRYSQYLYFIWGGFVCLCLVLAVYNVILYQASEDTLYLLYAGYLIAVLAALGVVHGYNFIWLPQSLAQWLDQHVISLNYAIAVFSLLFALYFLEFRGENPRVYRACLAVVVLLVCAGLASLLVVEYRAAQVFFLFQTLLYLLIALLLGMRLRQGYRWARYYFISWVPLYAGAVVGPLMLTGLLEYNFWTRHAFLFAVIFELTFISMALADRLRRIERHKLYLASYDQDYHMPNKSFLSFVARSGGDQPLTLLLLELRNFTALAPYLGEPDKQMLMRDARRSLEQQLCEHLDLVSIGLEEAQQARSLLLRPGVLALVVRGEPGQCMETLQPHMAPALLNLRVAQVMLTMQYTIGLTHFPPAPEKVGQAINEALQALEQAHQLGCDLACYAASSAIATRRKSELLADLKLALAEDQLALYHQPQIRLNDGQVYGSEVLLRWRHPRHGLVAPDEFIPLAEACGLIGELSRWVVSRAALQQQQLRAVCPRLSINLSTRDVCAAGFCNFLADLCAHGDLDPLATTLEVTETHYVADADAGAFKRNLERLKALGFAIAIDDFGTAYASLSYVSEHPVDELKLDKSFVVDLCQSVRNQTINRATIGMAKSLGIVVVAEGVEDAATAHMLHESGCPVAQGYHFARPMPLADMVQWLAQYTAQSDHPPAPTEMGTG
ncbi:EAL domain-containing protein [Simiduia sp. 21SJ11W-1]|uniref:EAL domain-containing protein n=1 Tax=Simiduia sp. 21SJ11W-1 TaxID=2909669 RepID=UPI0020A0E73E|nr:EAL domain-containing protein [Simiduia sp. 21SJ11W-1]UTA46940.1 EAL domain-containing protein [Simiduia sp. 21SJ11W-1]